MPRATSARTTAPSPALLAARAARRATGQPRRASIDRARPASSTCLSSSPVADEASQRRGRTGTSASSPPAIRSPPASGADVLREGGNAVDAAVGAMLTSFACEPLLTALGAGGYMLVVAPGSRAGAARLLRRGVGTRGRRGARPSSCRSASRSATRSRCSTSARRRSARTGCRPGCARPRSASGGCRCRELVEPARGARARGAWRSTTQQAYVVEILGDIVTATPECARAVRARRTRARRGRHDPPARARRRARAARRGRGRAVLHRRHRRGDRRRGWAIAAGC